VRDHCLGRSRRTRDAVERGEVEEHIERVHKLGWCDRRLVILADPLDGVDDAAAAGTAIASLSSRVEARGPAIRTISGRLSYTKRPRIATSRSKASPTSFR
jgi:hypothetical protein